MFTRLTKPFIPASVFLSLCLVHSTQAQQLSIELEIPVLEVAEYHRPYLAIWIADSTQQTVSNINVLYDTKMENREGEKWLKDLRQWWRRSGRSLSLPVDGVTGATRTPGHHRFEQDLSDLALAPGEYRVMVEAVREVGGRELLELPFSWPVKGEQLNEQHGLEELGRVTLRITD